MDREVKEIKLREEENIRFKKQAIGTAISNILIDVLNHSNPDYRTVEGIIRWGKVESKIHKVLGDRIELRKAFSDMLIEAVGGFSNRYRLSNGHIDWEALHKDAYRIIDDI